MTPQDQMSAFCSREGQTITTTSVHSQESASCSMGGQLVVGKLTACGAPGRTDPSSVRTSTCPHLQHESAAWCRGSKRRPVVHRTTLHERKCSFSSMDRRSGGGRTVNLIQRAFKSRICEPHGCGPL